MVVRRWLAHLIAAQELFDTIVGYGYDAFVIRHGKAVPVNGLVEPWRYGPGMYCDNYLFLPQK